MLYNNTMKKIELNMKKNKKCETIKNLLKRVRINKGQLQKLVVLLRYINRLIKGYTDHGKAFFVHGNRGRNPAITIDQETKDSIVESYCTKYLGSNFTHFAEYLEKQEDIKGSVSTITSMIRK